MTRSEVLAIFVRSLRSLEESRRTCIELKGKSHPAIDESIGQAKRIIDERISELAIAEGAMIGSVDEED